MIPAFAERWIRRLSLSAVLLCLIVIVLGAYTRLTHAGISCPDWPECYGHLTPAGAADSVAAQERYPGRPLHVDRAWHEMIHRYAAGILGLIVTVITALAIASRGRIVGSGYALVLFATVVVQAVLGMLTVTWLLKPPIVTLHLLFGMTTLGLLWWMWLALQRRAETHQPPAPKTAAPAALTALRLAYRLSLIGLAVLAVQFFLGAWTSANYAQYACPDVPTCQGYWWPPHMDFRDAFVLWRGLWVNFQGGVLPESARVAIYFMHRLGALTVTGVLGGTCAYVISRRALMAVRPYAYAVLAALVLQLAIGISMARQGLPLGITTAHTGGAALLLIALLALVHKLSALRATPLVPVPDGSP